MHPLIHLTATAILAFLPWVTATPLSAQAPVDPVPLYTTLGDYSRTISTESPLAQQYFDQGLRLTFGFGHPEARRSFREAIQRDPACAMCHWGLAWSLGPYINARMDSINGVEAYQTIRAAVRLRANATPVERALIDAMARRYARVPSAASQPARDSAYAQAMRGVVRRFPNDLDAGGAAWGSADDAPSMGPVDAHRGP